MQSSFFYFLFKLLEQIVVAIKYIDVYLATYATHSAIGRQLPNSKMHIWLILAIACYPHLIVVAKIFAISIVIIQVFIDERLTDIQYRTHFHHMFYANEPFSYSSQHHLWTTHLHDELCRWFYIESWRQVAMLITTILYEQ